MLLAPGRQLGQYQITSLIGGGGMGEVYRALDSALKRDVALKVLPAAFLGDADRMGRFQREAEVLASLDHPNIGPIYGIVESDGARALVLALVEGPTLADRIEAGPLPLPEPITVAKQIVNALEYAHERGVVHRDLKPANIKITPEGIVKVLDFGLAKVLEDEPAPSSLTNSPTLTVGHTRAGMILGTAAYMSPEQAIGRPVDRRSDIFSFGAVFYEMLTGERAFAGTTTPDVLEAVVKTDPDWSKLPAQTPPAIQNLLRRCLTKDRKERLQAIGEARIVLNRPNEEEAAGLQAGQRPARLRLWKAATAALVAFAAAGWWIAAKSRPAEPRSVTRFVTTLAQANGPAVLPPVPILSHDGKRLAYESGNQVYIRAMDEFDAKPVAGTEGTNDDIPPGICFSPDGQWIAFGASHYTQLRKVPVTGGAALTVVDGLSGGALSCHWGDDGRIYYAVASQGIARIPASGGAPESLVAPDRKKNEVALFAPHLLPGGKQVLFSIATTGGASGGMLALLNLETRQKRILLKNAGTAYYASTGPKPSVGHLVYFHNGSLLAAPFDLASLQSGTPAQVSNGVQGIQDVGFFGLSDSGTLAYLAGGKVDLQPVSTLVWLDRQGKEQLMPFPGRALHRSPRLSPDGRHAVAAIVDSQSLTADLWAYEFAGSHLIRLTFGGNNSNPVWTPDGKRLIYWFTNSPDSEPPGELRSVPVDNSDPPVTILASLTPFAPTAISPDGKLLLATKNRRGSNTGDVWIVPLDPSSGEKPRPFLQSENFDQGGAAFSPDGRWVSYYSNESGKNELYVVAYPGPGGKAQVSVDGAGAAHWNRNGREMDYLSGNQVMVVDVQTMPAFLAGTPKVLFESKPGYTIVDATPDTRRFLATRQGEPLKQSNELRVVLNWFEELRQRAK